MEIIVNIAWCILSALMLLVVDHRIAKSERFSEDEKLVFIAAAFLIYFCVWALGYTIISQILQ